MPHNVSWFDRMLSSSRVDARSTPLRFAAEIRIDKRREVRANLRAAASDIGTREAWRASGRRRTRLRISHCRVR